MAVGQDSSQEALAYLVSIDRKAVAYRLEAGSCKIVFFEKVYQAVHGSEFPYFSALL